MLRLDAGLALVSWLLCRNLIRKTRGKRLCHRRKIQGNNFEKWREGRHSYICRKAKVRQWRLLAPHGRLAGGLKGWNLCERTGSGRTSSVETSLLWKVKRQFVTISKVICDDCCCQKLSRGRAISKRNYLVFHSFQYGIRRMNTESFSRFPLWWDDNRLLFVR